MKRFIVLVATVLLMAGCSVPRSVVGLPNASPSPSESSSVSIPKCAGLYMQAEVSSTPVKGFWNCLTPAMQSDMAQRGYTPDDSAFATDNGYQESWKYIAAEDGGGFIFEVIGLKNNKKYVATIVVYIDSQTGLVMVAPVTEATEIS